MHSCWLITGATYGVRRDFHFMRTVCHEPNIAVNGAAPFAIAKTLGGLLRAFSKQQHFLFANEHRSQT
jgi:hypothetical protein